jgi:hypothetical protein
MTRPPNRELKLTKPARTELRSLTLCSADCLLGDESQNSEIVMDDLDVEVSLDVTSDELSRGAERSFEWHDGQRARSLRLRVPVGAQSGTCLRFAGEGRPGPNGQVGNLYLRLEVRSPPAPHAGGTTNSRVAGVVLVAIGVFLVALTEYIARSEGRFWVAPTFLGPFISVVGIGLWVHEPRIPILGAARRENLYALAGALLGALNLYRFGAFDPGSRARLPILVGLAAVGVFSVYRWVQTLLVEAASRRTKS